MEVLEDFVLTSVSGRIPNLAEAAANPLGPLAGLSGTWKGHGFNQIWRPFHGTQDRFLELNETNETLQFEAIPGDIPNRGFLQADINLHGLRYLQQIQDAHVLGPNGKLAGIHIEPGVLDQHSRDHQPRGSHDGLADGEHPARDFVCCAGQRLPPRRPCANLCAGQHHAIHDRTPAYPNSISGNKPRGCVRIPHAAG